MIVFGAACFNFGVHLNKIGSIDAKKYTALLEKALYESDYIERNSVIIQYDTTFAFRVEKDEPVEPLGHGGGFPLPSFFKLQFDILIPRHIQEEINKERGFYLDIQKMIRVRIVDTFNGPITLVQHESDSKDDGSSAVILVREYLKQHFENKPVYFEYIGPSPFHADFYISPVLHPGEIIGLDENGFSSKVIPCRGYDQIHFLYSHDLYGSDLEALDELINHLDGELAFFYLAAKFRIQKIRDWEEIESLYKELINKTNQYDWFSRIKLVLSPHSKLTHQLLLKLTSFEMMAVDQSDLIEGDYRSEFENGIPTYLRSVIDKQISKRREIYPTKQIVYFLEFHEKRLLQIWQTSILAISALAGAIIGSALTALASAVH